MNYFKYGWVDIMADKLIKRDSYVNKLKDYVNSDFVKVYIGIRRSGKTSLMHNIIDELKSMGVKDENIIFFSFESREYAYIDNSQQLDEIVFNKTKNLEGKVYLFFDEIQQVKGWEKSINSFRVSIDSDIYITDSNSKVFFVINLRTPIPKMIVIKDTIPTGKQKINNMVVILKA